MKKLLTTNIRVAPFSIMYLPNYPVGIPPESTTNPVDSQGSEGHYFYFDPHVEHSCPQEVAGGSQQTLSSFPSDEQENPAQTLLHHSPLQTPHPPYPYASLSIILYVSLRILFRGTRGKFTSTRIYRRLTADSQFFFLPMNRKTPAQILLHQSPLQTPHPPSPYVCLFSAVGNQQLQSPTVGYLPE